MIRFSKWFLIAALGLCLGFTGVPALSQDLPFQPGEELVYRIKWSFIPGATAVLKVLKTEILDGKPAQHFTLKVKSNKFVDSIYKVRSQIDGWTDLFVTHSLLYKKRQNEGRHRRNVVVTFDWGANRVRYYDFLKGKSRSAKLMPGAFDPLSAAFYFRTLTLQKESVIIYPVCDGKKCVSGRGQVVDREKIRIDGETYDTWVVVPELKHVGGVFRKTKDAKVRLWVTADHRRLPVKLTSKVIVGSFVAELVRHSGLKN